MLFIIKLNMKNKKINVGLDIDGVLADFTLAWHNLYPEISPTPNTWYLDKKIGERFKKMKADGILDEFYLNIPPLIKAEEIPFEPCCYITARPVDSKITEEWLEKHGYPKKPVITVGINISKIDAAKQNDVDIFIDDHYENFLELNNAGIFTYLYTASWNKMYNVGNMRLDSLKNLPLFHSALTN